MTHLFSLVPAGIFLGCVFFKVWRENRVFSRADRPLLRLSLLLCIALQWRQRLISVRTKYADGPHCTTTWRRSVRTARGPFCEELACSLCVWEGLVLFWLLLVHVDPLNWRWLWVRRVLSLCLPRRGPYDELVYNTAGIGSSRPAAFVNIGNRWIDVCGCKGLRAALCT